LTESAVLAEVGSENARKWGGSGPLGTRVKTMDRWFRERFPARR
jgi:hypothetical protein